MTALCQRWIMFALMVGLVACRTGGVVLVLEDFSAPGRYPWSLEGDEQGRTYLADGRLVIEVNAPETVHYVTLAEPSLTEFVLEVDTALLAGSPRSSYGVFFGVQENGALYRFDLTGEGHYILEERTSDGQWVRLTNGWEHSPAIQVGPPAANRMRLAVTGRGVEIGVNGQVLHQLTLEQDVVGSIALDAGTFSQGGVQAAFDNLVVREP